jgi:hypothetical protein
MAESRLTQFSVLGFVILALAFYVFVSRETAYSANPVEGNAVARGTVNGSLSITAGNTFQQIMAPNATKPRVSLTIQNNNTTTDSCWVNIGAIGAASTANSIVLSPGSSYARYWPYVPSDAINVTCATTGNTVYLDYQ